MTSEERRVARYKRRKEKRETKRLKLLEAYNFGKVIDLDSLYKAAKESRNGVFWKDSVQKYNMNIMRNIIKTRTELLQGIDIRKGFIEFHLTERGKTRHIRSVHVYERVAQKSLCTNALIPHLTKGLIYDNGASIKGKGIHFALNRTKNHLREHFRKHGKEGYILQIDFKGYFANIRHEPLAEIFNNAFGEDERLCDLSMLFVKAFGEYGLGLGSETSQINAIAYPSNIDHFIKQELRVRHYARYMDDSYFIFESKEQARAALPKILEKYEEKGIIANPKKTTITKLTRGFTFLKTHFSITETGRVVARPCRQAITRQRRKLKKFKPLLESGEMTLDQIRQSYMSWRGYIAHKDSRKTVHSMDKLYKDLFNISPLEKIQK